MTSSDKAKLGALAQNSETISQPEPRAGGPVFVVRDSFADPAHRHKHTGPSVMIAGVGFINVQPGLNILDAGTELDTTAHGLTVTDENLAGFDGAGALRELAETTAQPRALEHMLELQHARPFTGNQPRDPEIIALLMKRLKIVSGARQLDVSDLHVQARAQSMIAQSRAG